MYIRKDAKLLGMESNNRYFERSQCVRGTHGEIVDHGSFQCKMYIAKQQAVGFASVDPAMAGIKLAKYGKEQITKFVSLQHVYDKTWDIGAGYRETRAWCPNNQASIGQDKVIISISIFFILASINEQSFHIYLNSIHSNIY